MEKLVPGFRRGKPAYLSVYHLGKNAHSYHLYQGGINWVPTIPTSISPPGKRLNIDVELLTPEMFLDNFPNLVLGAEFRPAWMATWADIRIRAEGEKTSLIVRQDPEVEGVSSYVINGGLVPGLKFQKGSIFAVMQFLDVFSRPVTIQLHHNGHTGAWLSRQTGASARIRFLSFDGVRLRIVYHLWKGNSTTVVYMRRPSTLYKLGERRDFPKTMQTVGLEGMFLIDDIQPLRALERRIVQHGTSYEIGRVGAEISYSIISKILQVGGLILNEPARGGTDLFTSDRRIFVESRFIVGTPSSKLLEQTELDLASLTKRLRMDFRWNPNAEAGYAVLSYPYDGRIRSLVGRQIGPKKSNGLE